MPAQPTAALSLRIEGARDAWRVTFRYRPDGPAQTVSLAGSFNGWNPNACPMADADADGVWTAEIALPDGEHQYKFVLDGSRWRQDPLNPAAAADGHGGMNSLLALGALAGVTQSPAKLHDEAIELAGFEHDPRGPRYFQALEQQRVLLRCRTLAHDVSTMSVAVRNGGLTAMQVEAEGPLFAWWRAEVPWPPRVDASIDAPLRLEYTFVMADGTQRFSAPQTYQAQISPDAVFHTPLWARDAIWYQIFPERFRNADPRNDPQPSRRWTSDWFEPADFEVATGEQFYGFYVYRRMYGGDLQGIEQQLDYLKSLGVNALYLNPVFQADSNHKYNATSYIHVDEHFGAMGDYDAVAANEDLRDPKTWRWTQSDRIFLAFLKRAKAAGFRVIIDGVFNHVGVKHPAFVDVRTNGQKSRFADWFDVTSWQPFKYNGWFGFGDLPVFRKSATGLFSESCKQHIFDVTRRWMDPDGDGDPRDGIDGWRLDVPNEIPEPFWAEWRKLVKSINPDAYITGEIWDRADMWLDGRHFDAVMNYQFAKPALAWIGNERRKIRVSELDARLAELRLSYPAAATFVMQNLVDSHDTDRLVSMIANPDREYDQENRAQDNPNYNNAKPGPQAYARARLVALLQMTYVGAPMVYYGDEVGMWGADDPTCRKPMLWEDLQPYDKPDENFVMKEHLAFYREAIALRKEHSALRTGSFRTLLADDAADVWAFERADTNERVIVALNASNSPREVRVSLAAGDPAEWQIVFGEGRGTVRAAGDGAVVVSVPAVGGVVLVGR